MFLGISPVAGSINLMRSQTTLSAGLSDAKAIVLFFVLSKKKLKMLLIEMAKFYSLFLEFCLCKCTKRIQNSVVRIIVEVLLSLPPEIQN